MLISSYSRRSIGLRPPLATFDCRRTFFRRKCSIHFVENSKLMESREDRPLAFLSSSFYWFRVPSLAPQFLNLPRIQIRCSASWNIRLEVFFVWRHSCFAAGASYSWLRAYCFLRGSYFFPSTRRRKSLRDGANGTALAWCELSLRGLHGTERMRLSIDIDGLHNNGWTRVDGSVPRELCDRLVDALESEIGVPVNDPSRWDAYGGEMRDLVPIWGPQAPWD